MNLIIRFQTTRREKPLSCLSVRKIIHTIDTPAVEGKLTMGIINKRCKEVEGKQT